MTTDTLTPLKTVAKRLARTQRIPHASALDLVAREVGKTCWRGLVEASKQGWQPAAEQMESLLLDYTVDHSGTHDDESKILSIFGDDLVFTRWEPEHLVPMEADEIHGKLDGHAFYLAGDEFEVVFGSQGWEISLDQPPSAQPRIRYVGRRIKSAVTLDPAFVERAIRLLRLRARRMHAKVASDWPRRSTMPDQLGRARHPLSSRKSAEWHCLHCEGVHDGRAMAGNLWHCPDCGATPIDIFPEPFWKGFKPPA